MGVDISFNVALVVPFKDYETVIENYDEVRFDQLTGEKKILARTCKNLVHQGKELEEGIYELEAIIRDKVKLNLFYPSQFEYGKDEIFIGKSLAYFEHRDGGSKQVELADLAKMEEEIVQKMHAAGYEDVPRPFLFSFVDYN